MKLYEVWINRLKSFLVRDTRINGKKQPKYFKGKQPPESQPEVEKFTEINLRKLVDQHIGTKKIPGDVNVFEDVFWRAEPNKTNTIRILPPYDTDTPYYVRHQHYLPSKEVIQCPRDIDYTTCPICDLYQETGNKDYKPTRRFYLNIIDKDKPDQGPRVFACGSYLFNKIMDLGGELSLNTGKPSTDPLTDPFDGYNIEIERSSWGFPTYEVQESYQGPFTTDLQMAKNYLCNRWDIQKVLNLSNKSPDEISGILFPKKIEFTLNDRTRLAFADFIRTNESTEKFKKDMLQGNFSNYKFIAIPVK